MALSENATLLKNLVDPEVIADLVDKKLTNAIKFAPLANVDATLTGTPGSVILIPSYKYIGQAVVVSEAADIPIRQLEQGTDRAEIKKVANGGQISDEAVLSGLGDPLGQFANQLAMSIADRIDNEIIVALESNAKTAYATGDADIDADDVANALAVFGEDIDGEKVLLVNPTVYAKLRKATDWLPASEIAANILVKGAVGEIAGCQVVVTNRLTKEQAFIVKPGAVTIFLKRDTMVEADRDIVNKTTVITADKHMCVHVTDETKSILIKTTAYTPTVLPVNPTEKDDSDITG